MFQDLNKATVTDPWPLLNINSLIEKKRARCRTEDGIYTEKKGGGAIINVEQRSKGGGATPQS